MRLQQDWTLATAVPSEEVMTSSPGIPPPAVL